MPVILATQEAEIKASFGKKKNVSPYLKNIPHKKSNCRAAKV
jgi:hypothetical protein